MLVIVGKFWRNKNRQHYLDPQFKAKKYISYTGWEVVNHAYLHIG